MYRVGFLLTTSSTIPIWQNCNIKGHRFHYLNY